MNPAFAKLFFAEIEYLNEAGWKQKNVGAVIESPRSVKDLCWEIPGKRISYSHENALRTQKERDLKGL